MLGGVDCTHEKTNNKKAVESNTVASENHSNDLYAIKVLVMILVLLISFVSSFIIIGKCKRVLKSYQNWKNSKIATESVLYTNKGDYTKYSEFDNNVIDGLSIKTDKAINKISMTQKTIKH